MALNSYSLLVLLLPYMDSGSSGAKFCAFLHTQSSSAVFPSTMATVSTLPSPAPWLSVRVFSPIQYGCSPETFSTTPREMRAASSFELSGLYFLN